MYNFYYEKNGEAIGPYSAKEMAMMQLPEDTLVTEDSLNGEWRNANEFDFDELASMEFSDYDKPFEKNDYQFDGYVPEDTEIQQVDDENHKEESMSEEELQAWREKKRAQYAKERRTDNRFNGLGNIVGGAVTIGIGVVVTLLSGGSVIKIGLIVVGAFMILKGLIQVISGEDS